MRRGKVFLRKVTTTRILRRAFLVKELSVGSAGPERFNRENAKPRLPRSILRLPKTDPPLRRRSRDNRRRVARQTPPRPKPPVVKLDSLAIRKVEIPTVTNTERPVVTGPSVLTTRTNELMKSLRSTVLK